MEPPTIICPSCGSDNIEALIGISYVCANCGHWFRVINGQTQDEDDEDDGDEAE